MCKLQIYIWHTNRHTFVVLKFHGRLIRKKCLKRLFGGDGKNGEKA